MPMGFNSKEKLIMKYQMKTKLEVGVDIHEKVVKGEF